MYNTCIFLNYDALYNLFLIDLCGPGLTIFALATSLFVPGEESDNTSSSRGIPAFATSISAYNSLLPTIAPVLTPPRVPRD